jgi:hypothetical protein
VKTKILPLFFCPPPPFWFQQYAKCLRKFNKDRTKLGKHTERGKLSKKNYLNYFEKKVLMNEGNDGVKKPDLKYFFPFFCDF